MSPSAPSWMALYLASFFADRDIRLFIFNANLDYYRPKSSKTKTDIGVSKHSPYPVATFASEAWQTLQTQNFYRPEVFIAAIRSLQKHFLDCRKENNCHIALHDRVARQIVSVGPHLLIIAADSTQQLREGHALLSFVRNFQKDLPAFLACGPDAQTPLESGADGIITLEDLTSLPQRIPGLTGLPGAHSKNLPDITLFPFDNYAAPDTILDLRGLSGGMPVNETSPEELYRLKIKGVLLFGSDLSVLPKGFFPDKDQDISSLGMGLRIRLPGKIPPEVFSDYYHRGVRMILWILTSDIPEEIGNILFHASAAGIWNHLAIENPDTPSDPLLDFIAKNPNLVHSWGSLLPEDFFLDGASKTPFSTAYNHIIPIPGVPFRHFLKDPVYLLLYLIHHGAQKVMRWQVRNDGSVYTLGEGITYHFVKPEDLPPGYLDIICRMVEAGGSVDTQWVRYNMERAFLVGYAEEEGIIVGNSSLKHPREEYLKSLSQKTGFEFSGYLERGYTSVRPEYRGLGIGTKLLEGLTARIGDKKLFSIIAEDNTATQKMAIRNRTRKVSTFFSEKAEKMVGIWVPEGMLDA